MLFNVILCLAILKSQNRIKNSQDWQRVLNIGKLMWQTLEHSIASLSLNGSLSFPLFRSSELKCDMKFGVYVPPISAAQKVPVLYWLSGKCINQQFYATILTEILFFIFFLSYLSKGHINFMKHFIIWLLYFIQGLTCTEQNFITKAGAQQIGRAHV